jgi:hypothetical protein
MRQDTPAAIHLRRVSRYPDVMSIRRALVSILGCAVVIVGWPSSSHEAGREPVQGVSIEAKDLTPAEMAQVRRLVRPTGKEPWLIYGFRYGLGAKSIPRRTLLALYLQPDVERGRLRRGRVLHAEISAPPLEGQKASPGIQFTGKYVQIVAIGRRPEEVNGKWDLNRPFLVDGEFDDQTLFRLVALIRRSLQGPQPPNAGPAARISGSLAISRVRRIDDGMEVTLDRDDSHGEWVTLEERNGRLVIVNHGVWII